MRANSKSIVALNRSFLRTSIIWSFASNGDCHSVVEGPDREHGPTFAGHYNSEVSKLMLSIRCLFTFPTVASAGSKSAKFTPSVTELV
ncbi:hypothetical protein Fuma_00648 [Fuerstiella marisgermanici]|uniref:Uncharacterized protein n=1 Tax=Fuerstiella marisgermanici TaxID=1891926 RepID=A0A1P8WAF8_9PLAN|nr:hypothetical protein Fuma_00648 [Fuerstiella marisgermanici]